MTLPIVTDLLEALTIFCFGISWPISIRKSLKSKTTKGKSLLFEVFLLIGYLFGIARKTIQVTALDYLKTHAETLGRIVFTLSFFFYVFNFVCISIDVMLYFRNKKYDELREANRHE